MGELDLTSRVRLDWTWASTYARQTCSGHAHSVLDIAGTLQSSPWQDSRGYNMLVASPGPLLALPPESLERILSMLDIDDLLHLSRTCKQLRDAATDPVLHLRRLRAVPDVLSSALTKRPARGVLLQQRRPLISLAPHLPSLHLNSPSAAAQISAYLAVSRLLTSHRLQRAIERRSPVITLCEKNVIDAELLRRDAAHRHKHQPEGDSGGELGGSTQRRRRQTPSVVAFSLAPALRRLKNAQKADRLRQGMRSDDSCPGTWKTPAKVFERASGVWHDSDPRVLSVLCPSVKRSIRFWESVRS